MRLPRLGLRMTAAHHGRVQPLFEDLAGAGLDDGFAPHRGCAVSLLVEIRFDPLGLFG